MKKESATIRKTEEFTLLLSKLSLIEFLGIAKILAVPYQDSETEELYSFEELWEKMVDKFYNLKYSVKKDILKIIKASLKENKNGKKKMP